MQKVLIPPLKIQGIKSKLVLHIKNLMEWDNKGIYFEPFMGSGVVGFNIEPKRAIFSDTNPHIINFYNTIKSGKINKYSIREYLQNESEKLQKYGQEYYLEVRQRFNANKNSFDFLFLNRSCFNGLMRFNLKGDFNVPYCKKDSRFTASYITKIANQISWVSQRIQNNEWNFECCDFATNLKGANEADFIYCDPPYIDRHCDYFNKWSKEDERKLYDILRFTKAKFILSTWHSNQYRKNAYITELWNNFHSSIVEHFYHLGASESNRKSIKETLIQNYITHNNERVHSTQLSLFG